MNKKRMLMLLLPLACVISMSVSVQAATITACTSNKTTYRQGETGYLTVTIYNEFDTKIRVTELTATIDYYYADGVVYLQQFFTDATVPFEIQPNQSANLTVPFSLPANIAPGYIDPLVKAKTELWVNQSARWLPSFNPTYEPVFYVESPYRQLYDDQQALNDQLQQLYDDQQALNDQLELQYRELQDLNATTTSLMYLLGITTIAFIGVAAFFVALSRKAKMLRQPAA